MDSLEADFRQALDAAVPGLQLLVLGADPPVLEIPAAHPEVGSLEVELHAGEITVHVGRLTHSHFDPRIFEASTEAEAQRENIADVVSWIKAVLGDGVVIWSRGGAGGSYPSGSEPSMRVPSDAQRFLWSGPIQS